MYSWERQHRGWFDTDSNLDKHHDSDPDGYGYEYTHRHPNPNSHVNELPDCHADCDGDGHAATIGNVNVDRYEHPNGDGNEHGATVANINIYWHEHPNGDDVTDGNCNGHSNQDAY